MYCNQFRIYVKELKLDNMLEENNSNSISSLLPLLYHDCISPRINALKMMVRMDLLNQGDPEIGFKYLGILNQMQTLLRNRIFIDMNPRIFKNELDDLLELYPNFEVSTQISLSDKSSATTLRSVYCLVAEIINNLIQHDSISSLHLLVNVSKDGMHLKFEHDKEGLKQSEFEALGSAVIESLGILSRTNRMRFLNLQIIFEPGSVQLNTKSH